MDLKAISELLRQFDASNLTELRLDDAESHLYFSKHETPAPVVADADKVGDVPVPDSQATVNSDQINTTTRTEDIIAPIVGTVYLQPAANQAPFKQVGQRVQVGETVALIEAMKMMTDIKSTVAGTITSINVNPEQTVEYGQVLYTVTVD
ncbi:acetyl-CoA carboxylase biotin carboxyl carrier protein [Periweissella ghanensis]|uniref:Biotin carboxyl carrier protein of acetyl-CoA carboxylase n=1 Tax=Periweissella ghanensis TaxID=467997 RepID=A0ABN8BP38_9LACO|nr:biotin/lipoyl-containing protein [Periweissella ghanensis]MCM0601690.1 acetyl-CoA carboxylase biotin carboxyl carrier protein subunit [Periweissella ghanensis]CAH0418377.1 Biotin carboxyl carrier protein of acetyl-CoA carboxylase [Periweissella ghanensis]